MSTVKIAIQPSTGRHYDATRVGDKLEADGKNVFEMDAAVWAAYTAFRRQDAAWYVFFGQLCGHYAPEDTEALLITKS